MDNLSICIRDITIKFINEYIKCISNKYDIPLYELQNIWNKKDKIMNKGNGAGGSKTNYYGKNFEYKTNNQNRLLNNGFTKIYYPNTKEYYLSKTLEDKTIIFVLQTGLKKYIKYKYNINIFRCPDEAYIIQYNTGKILIKILEKKEQNVEGSVETKLWSGPSLKREYELVLNDDKFIVNYAFCLSDFLKKKLNSNEIKYILLNKILQEDNIEVLFGDDENYFYTLDKWINNS